MLRKIVLERGQRLTESDLARSGGVDAEVLGVAARIVEDVLPSTARFVGNPSAVRTDPRVLALADTLADLVSRQ